MRRRAPALHRRGPARVDPRVARLCALVDVEYASPGGGGRRPVAALDGSLVFCRASAHACRAFAERAALALTEAATRLSDPVPDAVSDDAARYYDETALAALVIATTAIKAWNRINVTTRQVAGSARR